MSILLIDNFDSFTFNLYQYIAEFASDVIVKRNNEITVDEIEKLAPEKIIISPGPGRPENAGISVDVIKKFHQKIPILGVCLGHQSIGLAFGATIVNAPTVMHGKPSSIHHDGKGVFKNLSNPFVATRYHSLVIDPTTVPKEIIVTARTVDGIRTTDDAVIMGIRHRDYPVEGVQFHPESILTVEGKELVGNFINSCQYNPSVNGANVLIPVGAAPCGRPQMVSNCGHPRGGVPTTKTKT